MNLVIFIEIITLLSLCTYSDIKAMKIPNKCTFVFLILGVITNTAFLGPPGIIRSFKGILLVFILVIVPYIIGGIGGGDVKMLAAIGSIGGHLFAVRTIVFTAIIGAIISFCILVYEKRLKTGLANVWKYICSTVLIQRVIVIEESKDKIVYFPYGIAISAGTILTFAANMLTGKSIIM